MSKEMMSKIKLKPRDLHMTVENESKASKARIVGFSVLMAIVSGGYQVYYDHLSYRCAQFQAKALAGQVMFQEYVSPYSLWAHKNTLSVLENKSFKDLKYIQKDWFNRVVTKTEVGEAQVFAAAKVQDTMEEWTDDQYDFGLGWFTQTERYDSFKDEEEAFQVQQQTAQGLVDIDSKMYDEWVTMHENVVWFDTAGCMQGGHYGDVNKVSISANDMSSRTSGEAYSIDLAASNLALASAFTAAQGRRNLQSGGSSEEYTAAQESARVTIAQQNLGGSIDRTEDSWWAQTKYEPLRSQPVLNSDDSIVVDRTTDVTVDGSINWNNEDLYKDSLTMYIELIEDCDIDCQAKGSQISIVAVLNSTSMGLISLNAIFMFIGVWRYRWRICSLYFTFFTCLFQFCIIVVSATMIFSKYSVNSCSRSLMNTDEGVMWTMADDYYVNVYLWITQLFTLFGFLCCGLCSAYKSDD